MNLQPLDKPLRNKLEGTIREARGVAEGAARASIEQLGVGEAKPYDFLSTTQKKLRCHLRAHGRQLGDIRCPDKETQSIDLLVEEVAYQHWHRMLFARFLAENNLLMYPDSDEPVPVTLNECEDLASEEGACDGWDLAARFAARMLPQIFKTNSPVFQLTLPPEHLQKLEHLLSELPSELFHTSDSLGWVYQFWQAKKKDEVNSSEVKIGARELPSVTQLFTEPYMVSFLLDNSLGAWWAARRLSDLDLQNAKDEEELRKKAALPGVPLGYLRFIKQDDGKWTPAAGTFEKWPEKLSELKSIDPCCGSGHFLVAALMMLVPMRMELEDLSASQAIDKVLSENIHGLEIDQRCVELAAFALALTAWRYPEAGGYRSLPELHVACSGLSVSVAKEEWRQLGLGKKNLTIALDWMHETFMNAPILGSLINPLRTEAAKITPWDELSSALKQALDQERSEEQLEVAVVAQGLSKAATLLAERYHWVFTNVPYLISGKQNDTMRKYCELHYPIAKNDLATVFLERCLELCVEGGTSSIVLPQNWLFLTTYRKFREKLLNNETWHLIARLGAGAFETISGEVVKAILITISRGETKQYSEGFFKDTVNPNFIHSIDVAGQDSIATKAIGMRMATLQTVSQAKQLENPDARVVLEQLDSFAYLEQYAESLQGISPADAPHYSRCFWEMSSTNDDWQYWQSTVDSIKHFDGKKLLLWYGNDLKAAVASGQAYIRGGNALGKKGIVVRQMGNLPTTLYSGDMFDTNCATIVPKKSSRLPAVWCFCSSPDFSKAVRQIDQKLNVTNATLVKIPFNLDHWEKVAQEKYPNGLPEPYSDDPTQWIFHGHPFGSVVWNQKKKKMDCGPQRVESSVLQIAVARLLGYRWPAELDPGIELADEQRKWVSQCRSLLSFANDTGIMCIPSVCGEPPATDRLLSILVAAYGDKWSNDTLCQLLKHANHADRTLESWLRDKFFAQHCSKFSHRPFIWHIWDGLRDGFAVLVNYHKLDYKNLERLIYTYLGDWIKRQKDNQGKVEGAEERMVAAEQLKKRLESILEGEKPYDIFVRWKSIKEQPIGWNPDLNDGVRLNIRPFMRVADVKTKGAGVLKEKPNINWGKDRGRDVASAPWYSLFGGDRINDHHLSLEEKNAAKAQGKRAKE